MTEYQVLYYRRTNKVHKSKGVSKIDGILTLDGSTTVALRNEDDDKLVVSKTSPEIARRALEDDETIVLGGYEVHIVSCRSKSGAVAVDNKPAAALGSKTKPGTTLVRRAMQPLLGKRTAGSLPVRRPVVPLRSINKENPSGVAVEKPVATATTKPLLVARPTARSVKKLPSKSLLTNTKPLSRPTAGLQRYSAPARTMTTLPSNVLPHIPLPATVAQTLRPHQVVGVDFLWKALAEGGGAILADEMGLGKTLMTIAVIAARHRQERHKQFIIVCPSSLVKNWGAEFDKWLGKAGQPKRVVIDKGGEQGLTQMRTYMSCMKQNINKSAKQLSGNGRNGQVLILSYDLFRMNADLFQEQHFGLLVVDEGHRLKSTSGSLTLTALESLQCDARLCITATPIQNNLGEFYAIANFVRPGALGELSAFRRDFERPMAACNNKRASQVQRNLGKQQSRALEKITAAFMLRRLQKDVLKFMLPPRTEALLFCQPSDQQCTLYRDITRSAQAQHSMADALTALTSLRKVCCHPFLHEEPTSLDDEIAALGLSGKLVVLEALLRSIREHAPQDKVVIVSNFTSALTLIEKMVLDPHQYTYSRLDGTTDLQNRQSLVDTFNRTTAERTFCFLLSSKAGGCGINLVSSNRLVLVDPDWNPANDIQAMGRVYRQGQTKPTTLYRLFTSGTVEEVIYQRQLQKGNLATLAVDGAAKGSSKGKFTKEEIKDCFILKEEIDCDTHGKMGHKWPVYHGADSLRALGCGDAPLLELAKTAKDVLRFVHIVEDDELQGHSSASGSPIKASQYNSDNEQECKFSDGGGDFSVGAKRPTTTTSEDSSDSEDEMPFVECSAKRVKSSDSLAESEEETEFDE